MQKTCEKPCEKTKDIWADHWHNNHTWMIIRLKRNNYRPNSPALTKSRADH